MLISTISNYFNLNEVIEGLKLEFQMFHRKKKIETTGICIQLENFLQPFMNAIEHINMVAAFLVALISAKDS